jgi:hypothetical protein
VSSNCDAIVMPNNPSSWPALNLRSPGSVVALHGASKTQPRPRRVLARLILASVGWLLLNVAVRASDLQAGFAEVDVTPALDGKPVFLAGFGHNRKATGVADPIVVRAVVLSDGKAKIAFAAIDIVGFFNANVRAVRSELNGFDHVVISSTHNHEGPDTLGLWGATAFTSGIDPEYIKRVEQGIAKAVRAADVNLRSVTARIGAKSAPDLLHDAREPIVKHDELVALIFADAKTKKPAGAIEHQAKRGLRRLHGQGGCDKVWMPCRLSHRNSWRPDDVVARQGPQRKG